MICLFFHIRNQILFHSEMFIVCFLIAISSSYYLGVRGVDGGQAILLNMIIIFIILKFYFYLKNKMDFND